MTEGQVRKELVRYSRKAHKRYLVGGTGGNFSARISGGRMVITASGISLGDTTVDNLVTVRIESYEWEPVKDYIPSKEYLYHADILRMRPDVGAVLHVHPPHTTTFAVKGRSIPMLTDAAFKQPPLPYVPFAPSGSKELQENVVQTIEENPDCKALFLEKHGIATLGKDVRNAYDYADLIEELARVAFLAEQL